MLRSLVGSEMCIRDRSRDKMAAVVARSPSRLYSRDRKICRYGDALSTIFLLAFVPRFLLLVFLFSYFFLYPVCLSSSCPFVCAVAICSSQQYVFYSTCSFCLCHLYPTPSRNYFSFLSSVALILEWRFLLCSRTRFARTLFSYHDSLAVGFSLSHYP